MKIDDLDKPKGQVYNGYIIDDGNVWLLFEDDIIIIKDSKVYSRCLECGKKHELVDKDGIE